MKLTDAQIKRTKPNAKPYKLRDGGGLFLWVTPSGGKMWRWAYRHEGRAKLMTFGKYPEVTLALARERHSDARKQLATGVDPMMERKAERAAVENSFESVATRWLEHWKHGKSPRHVDYVSRRIAADILPCFGVRPVSEIEAPEVVQMVKAIEARGANDIAKRALETTGQVFRFAIAHGYARRNPLFFRGARPRAVPDPRHWHTPTRCRVRRFDQLNWPITAALGHQRGTCGFVANVFSHIACLVRG